MVTFKCCGQIRLRRRMQASNLGIQAMCWSEHASTHGRYSTQSSFEFAFADSNSQARATTQNFHWPAQGRPPVAHLRLPNRPEKRTRACGKPPAVECHRHLSPRMRTRSKTHLSHSCDSSQVVLASARDWWRTQALQYSWGITVLIALVLPCSSPACNFSHRQAVGLGNCAMSKS